MDDTILINYLEEKATKEECMQVEAWVDASNENRRVLENLYYTLFLGDRQAAMNAVDVESSLVALKRKIRQNEGKARKTFHWRRYVAGIAAFLMGVVIAGGFSWLFNANSATPYQVSTEAGQRAQVALPDGTYVWLNASTQLAYRTSFWGRGRHIDLVGEAYFEVARNEIAPFTVNSRNIEVSVLGTKFNVRALPTEERVVTTLLSGSVQVNAPEYQGKGFLLKPGQTWSVDVKSYKGELMEYDRPRDVLLWINGKLIFEQETLGNIASTLEKHFDVHFIFDDIRLKSERYTCEFSTDDDIDKILDIVSLTNRLIYQKKGKQIHLRSKK